MFRSRILLLFVFVLLNHYFCGDLVSAKYLYKTDEADSYKIDEYKKNTEIDVEKQKIVNDLSDNYMEAKSQEETENLEDLERYVENFFNNINDISKFQDENDNENILHNSVYNNHLSNIQGLDPHGKNNDDDKDNDKNEVNYDVHEDTDDYDDFYIDDDGGGDDDDDKNEVNYVVDVDNDDDDNDEDNDDDDDDGIFGGNDNDDNILGENMVDYDNDNDCFDFPTNNAEITKVKIIPVNHTSQDFINDSNTAEITQVTQYLFGTEISYFSPISEINFGYNSSQRFNANIEICYPNKRNRTVKICPINFIRIHVVQESNEGTAKIITGQLNDQLIEEKICFEIKANNTKSLVIAAYFYGKNLRNLMTATLFNFISNKRKILSAS